MRPPGATWLALILLSLQPAVSHAQITQAVSRPAGDAGNTRMEQLRTAMTRLLGSTAPDSIHTDSLRALSTELRRLQCSGELAGFEWISSMREARCLWSLDGSAIFNLANTTLSADQGALYAEILTTTFGTVRTAVAAAIASGEDAEQPSVEAVQRLLSGGGNLVLGFQRPLVVQTSSKLFALGQLAGRMAADFPNVSAAIEKSTTSGAVSMDSQLEIASDDATARFFVQVRAEALHGAAEWYRALGKTPRSCCIAYGQLALGAVLWNTLVVTWTDVFAGDDTIKRSAGQLSVTARGLSK